MMSTIVNGIQRAILTLRTIFYTKAQHSIVARIEAETAKEEARANELRGILDAKRKLYEARAKTRQLMRDIDAVADGNRKETKV